MSEPERCQISIAICGTVGVPGSYGGFETLAENLVRYHHREALSERLTVYCSGPHFSERPARFLSADLRYLPLGANGFQSIPYDIFSMISALREGHNRILLLGVSGALALPLVRRFSQARIVTHVDGLEWQRPKWRGLARWVLRASERVAACRSHEVIADNAAIAGHLRRAYGAQSRLIAYGGDHARALPPDQSAVSDLPERYALALCRIEPENNIDLILEAFVQTGQPLVFVGNWERSAFGRALRGRFQGCSNLYLRDPVYAPGPLRALREGASCYIHGHSAGGTNPSLIEMMQFGVPVFAHGCLFNRLSTEGVAHYFETVAELVELLTATPAQLLAANGRAMAEIAERNYRWALVGQQYFDLLRT